MATIWLAVERHPDNFVIAAFAFEADADEYCRAPHNFINGYQLYRTSAIELSDFDIKRLALLITQEEEK